MNLSISWFDSHCHFDMLDQEAGPLAEQAIQAGVGLMLTIGTKDESNRKILPLIASQPALHGALGIHPHEAAQAREADFQFIYEAAQNQTKVVAIGECGFDFYYRHADSKSQVQVFYRQVEIALELGLPLVIHARDAESQVQGFLKDFQGSGLRGVFHSFTGTVGLAEKILQKGYLLSFNGICTFPKGENVREVLKITPLNQILLETDAPFLAPKPHRGRMNYPAYLPLVGRFVANFLRITETQLKNACWENSLRLFNRIKPI